jgi:hypothetical protein
MRSVPHYLIAGTVGVLLLAGGMYVRAEQAPDAAPPAKHPATTVSDPDDAAARIMALSTWKARLAKLEALKASFPADKYQTLHKFFADKAAEELHPSPAATAADEVISQLTELNTWKARLAKLEVYKASIPPDKYQELHKLFAEKAAAEKPAPAGTPTVSPSEGALSRVMSANTWKERLTALEALKASFSPDKYLALHKFFADKAAAEGK